MAHFAQLDEENKVIQVIVVHNYELIDGQQYVWNEETTSWILVTT
jgi:hypothetical protein